MSRTFVDLFALLRKQNTPKWICIKDNSNKRREPLQVKEPYLLTMKNLLNSASRTFGACIGPLDTCLFFVLIGLAFNPSTTQAQPVVSVTKSGDAYQVNMRMDVAAPRALVWQVLTDYDNLQRFVPGMISSRLISARGEPKLLEQKGESGVLFFKVSTTTVSRVEETAEREIRFDLVSGNLKRMKGSWTLSPHDHAISVGYKAEVVPEFAVPPLIGPSVMAQNVKTMVEGVVQEIERRKLAKLKE